MLLIYPCDVVRCVIKSSMENAVKRRTKSHKFKELRRKQLRRFLQMNNDLWMWRFMKKGKRNNSTPHTRTKHINAIKNDLLTSDIMSRNHHLKWARKKREEKKTELITIRSRQSLKGLKINRAPFDYSRGSWTLLQHIFQREYHFNGTRLLSFIKTFSSSSLRGKCD